MARTILYYKCYYSNISEGGDLLNPSEVEDTFNCEPDDVDKSEGISAVDLAVSMLKDVVYAVEASSTIFYDGLWYKGEAETVYPEDYVGVADREGAELMIPSAILSGFSTDEKREIYERFAAS